MRILVLAGQTCFAGSTKSASLHLDDEGLNCFDIWTFTSWCQQVGCLNVIRANQIDAESLKSIAKQVASAFGVNNFAYATARV